MISTAAVRGSLICTVFSRAAEPRIVISHSFRPRFLLPLQRRSQFFARAFISPRTLLQSLSKTDTRPEPPSHRDNSNPIVALHENIGNEVLDKKSPPSEAEVLRALQACHSYAALKLEAASNVSADTNPTSALLSLDEDQKRHKNIQPAFSHSARPSATSIETTSTSSEKAIHGNFEALTDIAYKIVSHPSVFLTAPILASYVSLQSLISDPSPIPAVFSLYANKPHTPPGSLKALYPNPRQAKYAIPSNIVSAALDAAIKVKDMSLCLDVIETSYGTPAYQRSKFIRKAAPAAVIGCLAPVAVFTLADTVARYQDEVDHSLAMKYVFVGMLAYVFFTGSLGMVALMTANDQMVRVTWIVGTPLRYRWLREEERAAYDKVAQAWGFEDPNKRGLEEGDEWELLREVVNRKGMYLDNPALMEGME